MIASGRALVPAFVLLVAGMLLAAAPPSAGAASRPSSGWYGGTAGSAVIGFRVTATGAVRDLRTDRLTATCSDGIARSIGIRPGATGSRSTRVRQGRFSWTTGTGDDRVGGLRGRVTLTGSFASRRRARGTVRVTFTWPTGATCRTATRRFTATRRRSAPAVTVLGYRIFVGRAADGNPLELAMTEAGNALRVARTRAAMACTDGSTVTLEVQNPTGGDVGITPEATYSGLFKVVPPAMPGRPAASGGAVEISGRVTPAGLDGAIRMTVGFVDGSSCDGGWIRFTLAGTTAAG